MKYIKTIIVILLALALIFGGYKAWDYFRQWEADRFSEINMLRTNQDMFLKKVTALSESITHIVNDVIKTTTVVEVDHTYESLKDEVIELKKDEEANKDEIEKLREELSAQRKAFLASDDTLYIKDSEGNVYLLYRDSEGNLQPASANIDKIIEHRELVAEVSPVLAEEKIEIKGTSYNLKAGGYYSFNDTYGVIISKEIFTVKSYSLNASLLLSDFEDFKFAVGMDAGYLLRENLELGIGYSTDKNYYIKLQYTF